MRVAPKIWPRASSGVPIRSRRSAEVSAAQNISRARASGQIRYARALRDNLPAVMAEFATGRLIFG